MVVSHIYKILVFGRVPEKTEGNAGKDIVPDDASEFTIAADLTLYANPLRCLNASKPPKPAEKVAAESGEIIAADLVKYGSPLDDKPVNK